MNEKNPYRFSSGLLLALSLLHGSCTNPPVAEEPVNASHNHPRDIKPEPAPANQEQRPAEATVQPAAVAPAVKPIAPAKNPGPRRKTVKAEPPASSVVSPEPEAQAQAVPTKTACGADLPPPAFSRKDVYRNRPFQPGESAQYEVSYMGIHAGYGNIDVESPIKFDGQWHQSFSGNASTGDWYEKLFIVKDKIRAISRPWDFGAAQFYIEQDEGSLFGRRFRQKKWIHYSHDTCTAFEKTEDRDKKIKNSEIPLEPGADDAFSAYFDLRTRLFSEGQTERILVYTSEKNWFLDARALGTEIVKVPAGTFKATKLELKTFLGQELQQKGDVFIWIAEDHPARPMVKIEAEIKIGKVSVVLRKFKEGRP